MFSLEYHSDPFRNLIHISTLRTQRPVRRSRRSTHGRFVTPLRPPPRVTNTARPGMSGFSFVKFALLGGNATGGGEPTFFNLVHEPDTNAFTCPGPNSHRKMRRDLGKWTGTGCSRLGLKSLVF